MQIEEVEDKKILKKLPSEYASILKVIKTKRCKRKPFNTFLFVISLYLDSLVVGNQDVVFFCVKCKCRYD